MVKMYSVNNFTKSTHKVVVTRSWMMKLWTIDTEEMENELACGSND